MVAAWIAFAEAFASAQVQDLGHRLPGTAGLDAGTQPDVGIYVGDRIVRYASDQVNDRDGSAVPLAGFELDTFANVTGLSGIFEIECGPYVGFSLAVPIVHTSLNIDEPRTSIDRFGLADLFLEPLKVGGRFSHFDAVASYALYAPTRQGERSGVGKPQWSHQLSAGGTIFFDDHRRFRLSALASYLINHKKQDIDITRGQTLQIQGGVGGQLFDILDFGVAGFALWQTTDDTGSDLPKILSGARERVYGLGPEIGVVIPAIQSRFTVRWEWDLGARARPVGNLLLVGLTVLAWRPERA